MALTDFQEFAAPPLAFPINGKTYIVPPVGILDGLKLAGVILGDDTSLNDLPSSELWKLVLGSAWDEMCADNCPTMAVSRAGMAALADFQEGRAVAERVWNSDIDPEALAALLAALSKIQTNSDAATTTPSLDSTSGTNSETVSRHGI